MHGPKSNGSMKNCRFRPTQLQNQYVPKTKVKTLAHLLGSAKLEKFEAPELRRLGVGENSRRYLPQRAGAQGQDLGTWFHEIGDITKDIKPLASPAC